MQAPTENDPQSRRPATPVDERESWSWPGIPVLIGALAAYGGGVELIRVGTTASVWCAVALFVLGTAGDAGLTAVIPGEVRVVQLFGGYRGTVRATGLRWVNPFTVRRRVSVRIRNKETPTVKVNDCRRQPHRDRRRRRLAGPRQRPGDLRRR